ncbi:LacI family DNA-binding transcriptional regulator [Haliovirga abyssi]|uniref:LacI family transcriptional regulator n=1 Tax=Haliovirga abyssi TaxID=2996794 RepID=A0AAU9E347_9FUSO|nr:LacI family DNA-binding transcriptional regulator [Haliovirga abyssi]BDU50850.1 LacI family transcriptional regulator [Haliovirga abyssi]
MGIKKIAKLADVSISTVSRVINAPEKVKEETRERVQKIIEENNYRPNLLAKELLKNKTNLIGVLLPRIDVSIFATAVEGVAKTLNEKGYNILLANAREKVEEEIKYFQLFQEKRVDGILFFTTELKDEHIEIIKKIDVPLVIIGQKNRRIDVPSVLYDYYNASKKAVEYLIERGHKKIAFLGVPETNTYLGQLSKEGYLDALEENGISIKKEYMYIGDFAVGTGYTAIKHIIEKSKEIPTAIYAATDHLAITAMHYLYEKGIRVPEDMSIVGSDDMEISKYTNPALTTIKYDYFGAGVQAANLVLDKVEGKSGVLKTVVIDYTLQERDSTKRIK